MKRLNLPLAVIAVVAPAVGCAPKPAATPAPEEAPTKAPPTEAPPAPAEAKHPALADNEITIAWIPKGINNSVFEIGKVCADVMTEMWEKQDFTITLPPLCEAGVIGDAVIV